MKHTQVEARTRCVIQSNGEKKSWFPSSSWSILKVEDAELAVCAPDDSAWQGYDALGRLGGVDLGVIALLSSKLLIFRQLRRLDGQRRLFWCLSRRCTWLNGKAKRNELGREHRWRATMSNACPTALFLFPSKHQWSHSENCMFVLYERVYGIKASQIHSSWFWPGSTGRRSAANLAGTIGGGPLCPTPARQPSFCYRRNISKVTLKTLHVYSTRTCLWDAHITKDWILFWWQHHCPTAVFLSVETSVKSPRKLHVCIVPTCSWDAHITERLNGILMTTSLPDSSVFVSAETWVKASRKLYVCMVSKRAYMIKISQKCSTLSKGLWVRG